MAVATLVYEDVIPDFTKRTPEESKLECVSCIKVQLDLCEAVSELKSAKEFIRILKENLDTANSSEHNASTLSNLNKQKDRTYF
jgi:hypothetical protein